MMTADEFRTRWSQGDEPPVPVPRGAVEATGLPGHAKDFLVEVGLPADAAPCLSFDGRAPLAPVSKVWPGTPPSLDRYRILGSDGAGNPICLDEGGGGAVVRLDHEDRFRPQRVNSSLPQFAESLLIYRTAIERRHENGPGDDAVAWAWTELARVDPPAAEAGGMWHEELMVLGADE